MATLNRSVPASIDEHDVPLEASPIEEGEAARPLMNIEDSEQVILVDEHDLEIGRAAKLDAHQNGGRMHRAFSIFVFNDRGEVLLQRRAATKYHFAGLWTNSCCSHPTGEISLEASARYRLRDEFGFDTRLTEILTFIYRAHDPSSGLSEYEFDHVFVGRFNDNPRPNPREIDCWRWVRPGALLKDLQARPELYTPWLRVIAARVFEIYPPAPQFKPPSTRKLRREREHRRKPPSRYGKTVLK